MPGFFNLPKELVLAIFEKVDFQGLARLPLVSKWFRHQAQAPALVEKKLQYLMTRPKTKQSVTQLLAHLEAFNLATLENKIIIIHRAPYAAGLSQGLLQDSKRSTPVLLASDENLSLLLDSAPWASNVANLIWYLHDKNLFIPRFHPAILKWNHVAEHVLFVLKLLETCQILTPQYITLMFKNMTDMGPVVNEFKSAKTRLHSALPLQKENLMPLLEQTKYVKQLIQGFNALRSAKLLEEYRALIVQHPAHAESLARSLCILKKANLLNEKNRDLLIHHLQILPVFTREIHSVEFGMKGKPAESLTQEIFTWLFQYPEQMEILIKALKILYRAKILTFENCIAFHKLGDYRDNFVNNLGKDIWGNRDLSFLTQPNFEFVLEHAAHMEVMIQMLEILYQANILTAENRLLLAKQPSYLENFVKSIYRFNAFYEKKDLQFLTQSNFEFIFKFGEHLAAMAKGIKTLHQSELLTPENQHFIAEYPAHADSLASSLQTLHQSSLLTPENRRFMAKYPAHAGLLATGMQIFHESSLLTPENQGLLADYPEQAISLARLFTVLEWAKLNIPQNRQLIIQNIAYIEAITNELWVSAPRSWAYQADEDFSGYSSDDRRGGYSRRSFRYGYDEESEKSFSAQSRSEHVFLTQSNFEFILKHKEYAGEMAAAFCILYPPRNRFISSDQVIKPPKWITTEMIRLISDHVHHARGMASVLVQLHKLNQLTLENQKRLSQQAEYAGRVEKVISAVLDAHDHSADTTADIATKNLEGIFEKAKYAEAILKVIGCIVKRGHLVAKENQEKFERLSAAQYRKEYHRQDEYDPDDIDTEEDYVDERLEMDSMRGVNREVFITSEWLAFILEHAELAEVINVELEKHLKKAKDAVTLEVLHKIVSSNVQPVPPAEQVVETVHAQTQHNRL